MLTDDVVERMVVPADRVNGDVRIGTVQRLEMGQPLDVIPMGVTQEQGNALLTALDQRFSSQPDPRSRIDQDGLLCRRNFHRGYCRHSAYVQALIPEKSRGHPRN